MTPDTPISERYIMLGLALGRHVDGLVDAFYGPRELAERAANGPLVEPAKLFSDARRLLADTEAGASLDSQGGSPHSGMPPGMSAEDPSPGEEPRRRRWLAAQVRGLATTAAKLAGEPIGYAEEVEGCYGVRPSRTPEDELARAHRMIDECLEGSGPLAERRAAWIEAHQVPVDLVRPAIASFADDLRERTAALFGLPDGEHIEFQLVTGKPWSGFNYYLGGLRSRVEVNTDLPVLSTSLAHLVAHEAYPGHHTEHTHKEVGLVCRRHLVEETIFLVGTPQCMLAEGLADLGLEIVVGRHPEDWVAEHLRPLGIHYDAEVVRRMAEASEILGAVRANAAFRLHEDGTDSDVVVHEVARWALLPEERAAKAVEFLTDPTWRAYITCYVEGLPLCRRFARGEAERFSRLLNEQMTPADLAT